MYDVKIDDCCQYRCQSLKPRPECLELPKMLEPCLVFDILGDLATHWLGPSGSWGSQIGSLACWSKVILKPSWLS